MHDQRDILGADLDRQVIRYVAGECSAAEAAALERRFLAEPDLAERVRVVREVWAATGRPPKRRDLDRAWQTLRSRLHEPAELPAAHPRTARFGAELTRFRAAGRLAAAAAAVLAIIVPAVLLWQVTRHHVTPAVPVATVPVREFTTQATERAELRLPDGTRVVLGVASRLRVPADFGARTRDVTLDGQAYFDVVHDGARPFRVRTALGVAEDLGTAFVVTTYPELGDMQVTVASGVVALASSPAEARKLVLRPGDHGRLDASGAAEVEHGIDVAARLAWTRGELVFRRTPLRQVLPQMERWYGVRIRLAAPRLGDVPVSASFAGETPAEALTFVAAAVGARLTMAREASGVDSIFTLHSR